MHLGVSDTIRAGRVLALSGMLFFAGGGCEPFESDGSSTDFGDNDPNLVVCCGDSMTAYGYPSTLAGITGKTVVNRGFGGYNSGDGIAVLENSLREFSPGYVVIYFGANDAIQGRDLDGAAENLRRMIQRVKDHHGVPILATLPPMYGSYTAYSGRVDALNERIRSLARSEKVRMADLNRAFGSRRDLIAGDGLHPSAAGNEVIAEVVASRIR